MHEEVTSYVVEIGKMVRQQEGDRHPAAFVIEVSMIGAKSFLVEKSYESPPRGEVEVRQVCLFACVR